MNSLWEKITFAGSTCVFIEIPLFANAGADLRHPYINEDIEMFNEVLRCYRSISIDSVGFSLQGRLYQPESVHFTREGHKAIASILAGKLTDLIKIH